MRIGEYEKSVPLRLNLIRERRQRGAQLSEDELGRKSHPK